MQTKSFYGRQIKQQLPGNHGGQLAYHAFVKGLRREEMSTSQNRSRLAPSLFRGISVLRKIITFAGAQTTTRTLRRKNEGEVLVVVYAPAEVIIFLSTDIPRNRLGASLKQEGQT